MLFRAAPFYENAHLGQNNRIVDTNSNLYPVLFLVNYNPPQ